ncbi:MAG TPA: hypothetical protein VGX46_12375 [Vicinamibacterales bacterium]|jgi:hypothetical protein|nr:hypothetical protein [Vicinamibacterales bacterium]
MTDEFSLTIERELAAGTAVRLTGVYARVTNVMEVINPLIPSSAYTVPITNPDPGPDGKVGSAGDPGTKITNFEYPAAYHGASFVAAERVNDPALNQSYKSIEAAAIKRLSKKWQAMGSFSATRVHIPATTANPNSRIFGDNNTTEWTAKAAGSYELPWTVLVSINYEVRSGAPWQRTVLFSGGTQIPTIVLPVEPLGAHKYDNLHLLDGRVRKIMRFANQSITVGADIYNVLNINTVTSLNTRSGATYGFTTSTGDQVARRRCPSFQVGACR